MSGLGAKRTPKPSGASLFLNFLSACSEGGTGEKSATAAVKTPASQEGHTEAAASSICRAETTSCRTIPAGSHGVPGPQTASTVAPRSHAATATAAPIVPVEGLVQKRRPSQHAQLTQRRRTRATDNQISCSQSIGHIVNIFRHFNVGVLFQIRTLLFRHTRQPFTCRRSCCVYMMIRHVIFALQRNRTRHMLIHIFCAHRPPEGNHHLVLIGQPKTRACFFAIRRENFPAHRSTGQHDLISAAQNFLGLLKANQHTVCLFGEHLCHLARQRVHLQQHRGNSHLLRGPHHRK